MVFNGFRIKIFNKHKCQHRKFWNGCSRLDGSLCERLALFKV
nr:MAG TPA: hypothetical protein [Caudoviricetes sp.]